MIKNLFKHTIKAVIINDGKILVKSCDYGRGQFSKLPGGGHQWGETMTESLVREISAELGVDATPKKLLFVRDYMTKTRTKKTDEPHFHMSELIFECEVDDLSKLGTGAEHDDRQEIEWLPLSELDSSNFVPRAIIPYLTNLSEVHDTIILGDVD